MGWNLRSKVLAMSVAIQSAAGVFANPSGSKIIPISAPTQQENAQTAADPTLTGTIWDALPVQLGSNYTIGFTSPLRGPGGTTPPAANTWPLGMVLQAAGWSETVMPAASNSVLSAGSSAIALALANTEPSIDDLYLGYAILQDSLGSGFSRASIISDYLGATKSAILAETVGTPPASGAAYVIPKQMVYRLGTLTSNVPLLSVSIWRDQKRIDFIDWAPTSLIFDVPVSNDQNQVFPSIQASGTATFWNESDDLSPSLSSAVLAVPIAPARGGKFCFDRTVLGHQSLKFTETLTVAGPSNQNQAQGQDARQTMSGSRAIDLDLNDSTLATFNLRSRVNARTVVPILSTWGLGNGNNFGLMLPNNQLQPFNPGDRNGFVNVTGQANPIDVNFSATFTIWWPT